MALRYILSFSAPSLFNPTETQLNFNFFGNYKSSWLGFSSPRLLSLIRNQDFIISGWIPGLAYTVASNLSATGTTQGTATALVAQDNEVKSSTANTQLGVIITRTTLGDPTIVHNYSQNDIWVWPPVNGQINGIGTNTKYIVSSGSSMEFVPNNNSLPSSGVQYYTKTP